MRWARARGSRAGNGSGWRSRGRFCGPGDPDPRRGHEHYRRGERRRLPRRRGVRGRIARAYDRQCPKAGHRAGRSHLPDRRHRLDRAGGRPHRRDGSGSHRRSGKHAELLLCVLYQTLAREQLTGDMPAARTEHQANMHRTRPDGTVIESLCDYCRTVFDQNDPEQPPMTRDIRALICLKCLSVAYAGWSGFRAGTSIRSKCTMCLEDRKQPRGRARWTGVASASLHQGATAIERTRTWLEAAGLNGRSPARSGAH